MTKEYNSKYDNYDIGQHCHSRSCAREVALKLKYDELLREVCKYRAKEVNSTLRTYDGQLTALDEEISTLKEQLQKTIDIGVEVQRVINRKQSEKLKELKALIAELAECDGKFFPLSLLDKLKEIG